MQGYSSLALVQGYSSLALVQGYSSGLDIQKIFQTMKEVLQGCWHTQHLMPASPQVGSPNLFLKIQFWHLVPSTAPVHQKYWPHSGLGTCRPSKGSISISAIVQGSCPCARLQHSPCPRLPNSKGLNHEQVSAFRLLCAEVKLACCHAVTVELAFEDAFRLSCCKQLAFEDYRSLLKWMCISIRSLLKWMCISIRSLLK